MDALPAIRACGITKSFGDVIALDGVDLDVTQGQILGLVGSNGAGETTLLGLLLGLVVADSGELEIPRAPVGRALTAPGGVAQQLGPLLIGIVVDLVRAVIATAPAYFRFLLRDFIHLAEGGSPRRAPTAGGLPLVALPAVPVAVVAVAVPTSGSGIQQAKVQPSLATASGHLYRRQTDELRRPAVIEAQLKSSAACTKGEVSRGAEGAGNDWRCVLSWHLPGASATGRALYQLDFTPDGRFVADGDGPKEVNGYFLVRTPIGDAPNPLWQFDGNVDLLGTTKG